MLERIFVSTLLATSLLSALSLVAWAQDAAPTAPAVGLPATGVQQLAVDSNIALNELHGDWSVRCFNVASQAPCDILQVGTNAESQQRVSLVSIAYLPGSESYAAQIIVPLGIALTRGLSIEAGEASLVGLRFNRCERDGCYVEIAFPPATIDALSVLSENTLITVFPYGQGEMIELPFSVVGFAGAIEHMKAEAQERAVEPTPQ
jgi:invasion protein IalB